MSLSKSSLKMTVLTSILRSFDPFKIGLRRRTILDHVIHGELEYILNCDVTPQRFELIPRVFLDPLTTDEKNALDMRLLRVLENLVQEGLIKRETKDNKQVFYLIEKDAFPEFMESLEECSGMEISVDKEEWDKNIRQTIITRSGYLKLPDYLEMIPIKDWLFRDLTYEEFRSIIMNVANEVLEPQIKTQYELMKKE